MKYFIITGASRGLGEGLAMELLGEQHHLLCISRSESDSLKKMASAKNVPLDFFPVRPCGYTRDPWTYGPDISKSG